jgi:hypothetical protein
MKKLVITATALMFVLGMTVASQAQGTVEKGKTTQTQVQKVTNQETGKVEAPKALPAEANKVEPASIDKKLMGATGKKAKEEAGTDKQTAKEVKTSAVPVKKTGPETPKSVK